MENYTIPCARCGGRGTLLSATPEALREARKAAGMTLRQLASDCGLSVPYLSHMERGKRPVTERAVLIYSRLVEK